ncbi:unannotated protein [freshwater metagenome]|uniref:Unannotated protein n=1 Tax=freshwater metagenome TaxID=449393 RepID=A0A6J7IL94_9ZZZZ|nr:hypothetical protein [Actinomycetota bacterium]
MSPRYAELDALGTRLLVAAGTGDVELVERLVDDWSAVVEALPAVPDADAGPALARAAGVQAQLGVLLGDLRDRIGDELARSATGRRTAAGYGAGVASAGIAGGRAEHRA